MTLAAALALARRLHHATTAHGSLPSAAAALALVQQQCSGSLVLLQDTTASGQLHQQRHLHTPCRRPPTVLPQAAQAACPSSLGFARSYAVSGVSQISPLKLSEVMRMEELMGKSGQEVAQIWLAYHASSADKTSSGRAGAVYSADDWALIQERAKKSPMFVLPLAKPGGYVTLVTQQQLPVTLVTTLEEFRKYGSGAPATITITHYPELLDSAKVVLVRADIVNDKLINQAEARTVLELLRALYTDGDDYKMVLDFNHHPEAFTFEALLTKMGIDIPSAEGAEQKSP